MYVCTSSTRVDFRLQQHFMYIVIRSGGNWGSGGVVHPLKSNPRYIVKKKRKRKKNATSGLDKTNNE